jgi:hypothetical protein
VKSGVEIINMPTYHLKNNLLVLSQQLQTWRRRETLSLCRTNLTAVCTVCAAVTLCSHSDLKTAVWLLTDVCAVGRLVYCDVMFGTVCCLLYLTVFISFSLCLSFSVLFFVLTVFSVCLHFGCVDGVLGLSPHRLPHCGGVSHPLSPCSRSHSWFVISGRSEVRILVGI